MFKQLRINHTELELRHKSQIDCDRVGMKLSKGDIFTTSAFNLGRNKQSKTK